MKGLNQLHAEDLTSAKLVCMVLEEMIVYRLEFFWVFLERGQPLVIIAY